LLYVDQRAVLDHAWSAGSGMRNDRLWGGVGAHSNKTLCVHGLVASL